MRHGKEPGADGGAHRRNSGLGLLAAVIGLVSTCDQFIIVDFLWYLTQHGYSGIYLGAVVFANGIPAGVSSPFAGWLFERFRPVLLLGADNLIRAFLLATIPVLYAFGSPIVAMIFVVAAISGALSPISYTGIPLMVPRIVSAEADWARANTLISAGENVPYLAGPAIAGVAIAVVGAPLALLVPVAALIAAALIPLALPAHLRKPSLDQDSDDDEPTQRFGWAGLRTTLAIPGLRAMFLLTVLYSLAWGPMEAVVPVLAKVDLHTGSAGYGLLWTFTGLGSIVGLLGATPLARFRPGIVTSGIAILAGFTLLPLAFATSVAAGCVFMCLAGLVYAPYTAIEYSVLQRLVPQGQLGQLLGTQHAAQSIAAPLGAAIGGAFLLRLSAPSVLLLCASAIVVTGLGCMSSRSLRAIPPPANSAESPGPEGG